MTNYILELKQRGYDKCLIILYFDKYLDRVNIEIVKEDPSDIYLICEILENYCFNHQDKKYDF